MNGLHSIVLLSIGMAGCISAEKRVADEMPEVQREWSGQVERQANLSKKKIDWPQALEALRSGNQDWRASRNDVTSAKGAVQQVYKDLRPQE